MKDHDVTKLPVWAQDRIRQLENSVEFYQAKAYKVEASDTNVWITWLMEKIHLPQDSIVVFKLANGKTVEVRHDNDGETLSVRALDRVAVHPHASNSVSVSVVTR